MMTFTIDDEQEQKIRRWVLEQLPRADGGAIGGRLVFTFCDTHIGRVTKVRDDISGQELDITDYEAW